MKPSELFARAVELITGKGAPASRAEVEQAIRDCETRASAAVDARARLSRQRRILLTSGAADAELTRNSDDEGKARLEEERANALAVELRERLAAIVAAEAAAERAQRRAEVEHQCELATEDLRTRYPKMLAEVRSLLRQVATAQVAAEAFAKAYPDEPRIADPEHAARAPAPAADQTVSEREVWRWELMNGVPLQDMLYTTVTEPHRRREREYRPTNAPLRNIISEIEAGQYQGSLDGPFESRDGAVRLVRKLRREVLRQDRQPAPLSLATTIVLPGLLAGDPGWKAPNWAAGPAGVLAQLEELAKPVARKPKTIVEYLPVPGKAA